MRNMCAQQEISDWKPQIKDTSWISHREAEYHGLPCRKVWCGRGSEEVGFSKSIFGTGPNTRAVIFAWNVPCHVRIAMLPIINVAPVSLLGNSLWIWQAWSILPLGVVITLVLLSKISMADQAFLLFFSSPVSKQALPGGSFSCYSLLWA